MGLFKKKLRICDVASEVVNGMKSVGKDAEIANEDKVTAMIAVTGKGWGMAVRLEDEKDRLHIVSTTYIITGPNELLTINWLPDEGRKKFREMYDVEQPSDPRFRHIVDREGKPIMFCDVRIINEPSNLQFIVRTVIDIANISDMFPDIVGGYTFRALAESNKKQDAVENQQKEAHTGNGSVQQDCNLGDESSSAETDSPLDDTSGLSTFMSKDEIKTSCDWIVDNLTDKGYKCKYGFFSADSQEIYVQSKGWGGKITITETSFALTLNVRLLYMRRNFYVLRSDLGDDDIASIAFKLNNIPENALSKGISVAFNDRGEIVMEIEENYIPEGFEARDALYTLNEITDGCTGISESLDELSLSGWKYTRN